MIRRQFLCFLWLLLLYHTVNGQNESGLNRLWGDFAEASTSALAPASYDTWLLVGYGSLATYLMLNTDGEFHEEFGLEKEYGRYSLPGILGDIGMLYDQPGVLQFTLGLTGLMYGTGQLIDDRRLTETTSLMVRSVIITGLFTTALKVIIGRARPYVNNNPHDFKPFNFRMNGDYMSMPSGHTSTIFAMMTVIAKQYPAWYVQIPAYTFTVSVAMQRMNHMKHWSSDLLIGGTLGYLIGTTVVNRHRNGDGGFSVQPLINSRGVGLAVQF